MRQELGNALGSAAVKSTPAVGAYAAVETGMVPPSMQTIVLILTAVGVIIQFSYTLWKWNCDRKDRRAR